MGWKRKGAWIAALTLAAVVALAVLLAAFAAWTMHRSVPTLDGALRLPGLAAPLVLTRDALGTAVLRGDNRLDVARGLGFVHAQERFFEMDLTRRSAAGELSELFGPLAVPRDKARRVHRLRARLEARFARMDAPERALLQAYADGVNAGLGQLGARPWQYLLLRVQPAAWRPVDSLLVIGEMYWMLQSSSLDAGFERALLRERAGNALFDFLEPHGGRWDAALDASASPALALPGPEALDVRHAPAPPMARAPGSTAPELAFADERADERADAREPLVGSNDWAVDASRSTSGAALLADDMHLGLGVPALWFRAQLEFGHGDAAVRAAGVTLPGLPGLVVGSNGAVAWGFTNAYGQWFDWIALPAELPADRLAHAVEKIRVKGAADVALDVASLDDAPVVRELDGRRYALRWIADDGDAYGLALDSMLTARSAQAALEVAQRAGMPHQNILVADSAGHIAWTIAGRLWAGDRAVHFGRFEAPGPTPAAAAWLAPADYPVVRDPADGQLWTANARQLGGAGGAAIGDGGFDLGARAQQIRDRLAATPRFDEASLGAIQLDDDARFMGTWAALVGPVVGASPAHAEAARLLRDWNGRADADQAAYRLLRATRTHALDALWLAWTTPLLGEMQSDPARRVERHPMFEYAVERALADRPVHLLPLPYATWDAFLLAQVDAAAAEMTQGGKRPLAQATWGEANASRFRHVLSRAVPVLAPLLDLPSRAQSGDANLPHVAAPAFGQSERLVVAPGHEERATLTMPGGQSGHPMSPYYGAGQEDWVAGRSAPLLAGPAQHAIAFTP